MGQIYDELETHLFQYDYGDKSASNAMCMIPDLKHETMLPGHLVIKNVK